MDERRSRYLVAIASYRRPRELGRLLDSLEVSIDPSCVDVVVVDNDPLAPAREVVMTHHLPAKYCVEAEPGIVSARNRSLEYFSSGYRAILFVDDDEWVAPDWFAVIVRFSEISGADVVLGAVRTVLPDDAPLWMHRGGFYQRPEIETGRSLSSAATNNTLLRYTAWERAGFPEFDASFTETGGEDYEFFWRVRSSGAKILYCAEARVSEDVPATRLSFKWLWYRSVRNGVTDIRITKMHDSRSIVSSFARGGFRGMAGIALLIMGVVAGRGVMASPIRMIAGEWGRLLGAFGYRYREYRRIE